MAATMDTARGLTAIRPVQIHVWATSTERALAGRTAGAAMSLRLVLFVINAAAVIMRCRCQHQR